MPVPPATHLDEIRHQVHELAADLSVFRGLSIRDGAVNVGLRADAESLAAQLHESYGSDVRVTLGRFPYPRDRTPTIEEQRVAERLRNRPADEEVSIPGLEATLELNHRTVVSGRDGTGRVTLRNVGGVKVEFSSEQPLVGGVNAPASGDAVGGYVGAIAGTGRGVLLFPGDEQVIDVIFGTASWDLHRGYALPPGRYVVTARVPVMDSPGTERRRRYLTVDPADLTIVAPT